MGDNMSDIMANQQTELPVTPSHIAETNVMFEGKNIHQSPVDGKPLCSYSDKVCMQRRLNGYAFCIRHILEDKCAPFKQCQFVAKYNGSRCINPVPVLEERRYCNSHLQVLGLVPKKARKKRPVDDTGNAIPKKPSSAPCKKQKKQPADKEKTAKKPPINGTASKEGRSKKSTLPPPLTLKEEPLGEQKDWNVPVKSTPQKESSNGYFLDSYVFDYDDSSDSDSDTLLRHSNPGTYSDNTDADDIKYQRWQIKKWLKLKRKEGEMSYSRFQSYVKQVRTKLKIEEVIIDKQVGKNPRIQQSLMQQRKCSLVHQENCQRNCLPYSRFCLAHIDNDSSQVLFQRCKAETSDGIPCRTIVLQHSSSNQLCRKHTDSSSRKMGLINTEMVKSVETSKPLSITKTEKQKRAAPSKTERKTHKSPSKVTPGSVKPTTNKGSLKAHIQKKFSILPTFTSNKLNLHVKDTTPAKRNLSTLTEGPTKANIETDNSLSTQLSPPSVSNIPSHKIRNDASTNSVERHFVGSGSLNSDSNTKTISSGPLLNHIASVPLCSSESDNKHIVIARVDENQPTHRTLHQPHHKILINQSEPTVNVRTNSNFVIKASLQQGYTNTKQTVVDFNNSKPIPIGNMHKSNFALPIQPQHSLKSLIRFTGPFTSCNQGTSLISPPFTLAGHNQSQLFHFDPNISNQVLPPNLQQHQQMHPMHHRLSPAIQTQFSTAEVKQNQILPNYTSELNARNVSPKSKTILVPSDVGLFASKATHNPKE